MVSYEIGDEAFYFCEGQEPACGTGLDWVGSSFGLWDDISKTAEVASSVADSNGATFVPALFGLRAPHHNNKCQGAFIGLTTSCTKAHLVRAALEGICWRMFELLSAINAGSLKVKSLRIGGGVSRNDFICQFLADIMGMEIKRSTNYEASVKGAALMAGIACNWFEYSEEGKKRIKEMISKDDTIFKPTMTEEERSSRFLLWRDAIERVK